MAPKSQKKLKDRHKQVLDVIQEYTAKHGFAPSYREICDRTDITSTSMVNYYLEQLEEMGYIERSENISRSLQIKGTAREKVDQVLGDVKQAVEDGKIPARRLESYRRLLRLTERLGENRY